MEVWSELSQQQNDTLTCAATG